MIISTWWCYGLTEWVQRKFASIVDLNVGAIDEIVNGAYCAIDTIQLHFVRSLVRWLIRFLRGSIDLRGVFTSIDIAIFLLPKQMGFLFPFSLAYFPTIQWKWRKRTTHSKGSIITIMYLMHENDDDFFLNPHPIHKTRLHDIFVSFILFSL